MRPKTNTTALKKLRVFTASEAIQLGFSQPTLSRLTTSGELIRLEKGIFRHKDAKINFDHLDFVVATKHFGVQSAIGLISALAYYGLIEQVPQQIWVLVPPTIKTKSPRYRCIRIKSDLTTGIDHHKHFAITNIERTIVEAFKYSTKVGLDVAVRAVRLALRRKRTTATKLLKQAKELKIEKFILRHWEAITID